MDDNNYNNIDNIKKEDQPFYSKYYVKNFEEELNNTKLSFKFHENFEEDNLYCDLVEEE